MTEASGIAFIADGSSHIQVVNYLPFDNHGQVPTLSISSNVADLDPNTPGMQILEGTTIPIQANVQDDVQVATPSPWLTARSFRTTSRSHSTSRPSPRTSPTSRARSPSRSCATDTGGNTMLSDPLIFDLVPDTFAPTIDSVSVGDGDLVLKSFSVRVVADKSLAASTVTQATFELLDPNGNEVTPQAIQLRRNDQVIQLDYQTLPPGNYELIIHSGLVTDRAGNALAADVIRHFIVTTATTRWIGSSGDWSNPANWFNGVVPGATDDVLIDVPGGDVTINYSQGNTTINSLTSNENFVLSGGTFSINSTSVIKNLALQGGTLTGAGDLTITGVMTWTAGTLSGAGTLVMGSGAALNIQGNVAASRSINSTAVRSTGARATPALS